MVDANKIGHNYWILHFFGALWGNLFVRHLIRWQNLRILLLFNAIFVCVYPFENVSVVNLQPGADPRVSGHLTLVSETLYKKRNQNTKQQEFWLITIYIIGYTITLLIFWNHILGDREKQFRTIFFGCVIGYNEFDFLKKIKNTDPLMGAKLKSKTHYLICFLIFGAVFCAFGFKVWKKYYSNMT